MKRVVLYPLLALALMACVTINVYFPEAAIKDLSEKIEEEVQKQATEDAGNPEEGAPPAEEPEKENPGKSARAGLLDMLLGVTPVHAQEVPAPEVSNPAIRKIIAARADRLPALEKYKRMGAIGENNQALLDVRKLDAVKDLRERAELQRLVRMENSDREALYREIAAEKGVDLSQLPRIRETYAETLRQNARPGDWIQLPDGTWKQK